MLTPTRFLLMQDLAALTYADQLIRVCYGKYEAVNLRICSYGESIESTETWYIFHCYEILRSCRTIADLLNRQHFKTTMGNNWNAKAIEAI